MYRLYSILVNVFLVIFVLYHWLTPVYSAGISGNIQQIENTISTNGEIYSFQSLDNILYIAGSFTEIRNNKGDTVTRSNLASYDTQTETFTTWNPAVNGAVKSITVNYNTIYIAGDFTEVNSQQRKNSASFNRQDNSLTSWNLAVEGTVHSLALDGSDLYVGGLFNSVYNLPRRNLAIYDTENNRLVEWSADINGGVYAIIIDPLTAYIGGEFTEINGQPRKYLAAFDKSTGQLTDWSPPVDQPIRSLVVHESQMFLLPQQALNAGYASSVILPRSSHISFSASTPTATPTSIQTDYSPGSGPAAGIGGGPGQVVDGGRANLGFRVPNFSEILTFFLRGFFVIAGIVALFFLLLGAFNWITSGGDKDAVAQARNKIQSAIVGLIMMVVVLTIVVTLEQIVFSQQICLGLSCPASIPVLIEPI